MTTQSESRADIIDGGPRPVPAFAARPVLWLAAAVFALLMLLSGRYGYLTDETYFLASGKFYLDWDYMDQQPLVPLLTAFLDWIAPGSLVVFRLPAALATAAGITTTALIARELGGGRRAQLMAAAAYPLAPWLVLSGHWTAASTMEPPMWGVLIWLLLRWIRLYHGGIHRDRLLIYAGVIATVALYNKYQVVVLCLALTVSLAIFGPRVIFRRRSLWVAALIPVASAIPLVWWQIRHDWPVRDMARAIDSEADRLTYVPEILLYCGPAIGSILLCYGVYRLVRAPELAHYRFLGWAMLGMIAFFVLSSARITYLAGMFGPMFAAGAVSLERVNAKVVVPAYVLSAVLPIVMLPIYPADFLNRNPQLPNYSAFYETGWPEMADTVKKAYDALPPEQREHTVVMAERYFSAGALDVTGRRLGLPRVYGPDRGYWYFGAPPPDTRAVLYVGNKQLIARYFRHARLLGTVETPHPSMVSSNKVTLFETPDKPWPEIWQGIRTL